MEEIEASKPPRFDLQKVHSVIEMTFLYGARHSVVLLRPNNEVKLPPQSYGEMGMRKFSDFISQRREDPRRLDLLTRVRTLLHR